MQHALVILLMFGFASIYEYSMQVVQESYGDGVRALGICGPEAVWFPNF